MKSTIHKCSKGHYTNIEVEYQADPNYHGEDILYLQAKCPECGEAKSIEISVAGLVLEF